MNAIISSVQGLDNSILIYIKNNMHGPIMDKFMVIMTSLGNGGFMWIVIGIILLISKKYRKVGFITLIALLFSAILGEGILKHLVQRSRPFTHVSAVKLLIAEPLSFSFPSGHAASSFAAAGVLAKYFKDYALEFFSMASIIAFSRLYLYVHYPTDVAAGIVLGLICSKAALYLYNKLNMRK